MFFLAAGLSVSTSSVGGLMFQNWTSGQSSPHFYTVFPAQNVFERITNSGNTRFEHGRCQWAEKQGMAT
jgi:hypothetical protein